MIISSHPVRQPAFEFARACGQHGHAAGTSRHVTAEALQAAIPVVATAGSIALAAALLDFLTDYGFIFLLAGI